VHDHLVQLLDKESGQQTASWDYVQSCDCSCHGLFQLLRPEAEGNHSAISQEPASLDLEAMGAEERSIITDWVLRGGLGMQSETSARFLTRGGIHCTGWTSAFSMPCARIIRFCKRSRFNNQVASAYGSWMHNIDVRLQCQNLQYKYKYPLSELIQTMQIPKRWTK
jgi:hypothetical protein